MTKNGYQQRGLAVPSGRMARMARFGGLTSRVLGNMALEGGRQALSGQRPDLGKLLLTPANATRITHQLAQMRGAAMKIGQLVSMEAGELVPREFADILAHLRSDAHHMPGGQLKQVLIRNWGPDFLKRFKRFDVRPIAAASIGQVHRAQTSDGRDVAVKVQYPGVRDSIDSDVRNVGALIRMPGLLPSGLDVAPLLEEARAQLHEEADYAREGQWLARFGALLSDSSDFIVPERYEDLSTRDILAMRFVGGIPVEQMEDASQEDRDRVVALLVALVLRELFEFRLMQTDPNFANYRYDPETRQVVLLDFGATRAFSEQVTARYRALLRAGLAADGAAIRAAAIDIGYFDAATSVQHQGAMLEMFDMAMTPLRHGGHFDFGDSDLAVRLRDAGMALGMDRSFWHIPPMDTLFLQRKIAGMYLLAARLRARVDLGALLAPYV